jgi:hypothetical protein
LKKSLVLVLAVIIIVVIAVSAFVAIENRSSGNVEGKKPFYVGVTYCGNSTQEAQRLIDRVQSYTNLFILQSGPLQNNQSATIEIGDYAVNHGLNLILYYGSFRTNRALLSQLLDATGNRWGDHFLGFYFGDEPAGKMLGANNVELYDQKSGVQFYKTPQSIFYMELNGRYTTQYDFYPTDAKITITQRWNIEVAPDQFSSYSNVTTYYSNGTITVSQEPEYMLLTYTPQGAVSCQYSNGTTNIVTDQGNITQFKPYNELWNICPTKTYDETADLFIAHNKNATEWLHSISPKKIFTSDYALYWFDYKGGYDTVFAQLGINNSAQQQIALVRGAATAQNKSWGTFITYASNTNPVLPSGDEMYRYLKLSYEQGATYAAVFNYAPKGDGKGLLQEEHYATLQKFWNDVKQNAGETINYTAAKALVLPKNYGFGLRVQKDNIWGFWPADAQSTQVWSSVQSALSTYGSGFDIVYDDPAYPLQCKYNATITATG